MTVYTTILQDDSNLQVQLTEADDLVTLSLTSVSLDALVTSVNGESGIVVLDTDDIAQGATNLYYSDGLVDTYLQSGGVSSINFGGNTSLTWNNQDSTLEFPVNDEVTLQVGQEQLIHIRNTTGQTLDNGKVVYVTGAQGGNMTVAVADTALENTSAATIAVMTQTLLANEVGFATVQGLVRGLNTSAYAEGAALYLNSNGDFSPTKPQTPNHLVPIGWVVNSNPANGSIYVHINNGQELEELHDVLITNAQTNDLIVWDAVNGYWKNQTFAQLDLATKTYVDSQDHFDGQYSSLTGAPVNVSAFINDAGYITEAQDNQTLSFVSPNLSISAGNTVDLSAILTGYATEAYADQAEADAITSANLYADGVAATAESNANTYTDNTIPNSTIDGGTF